MFPFRYSYFTLAFILLLSFVIRLINLDKHGIFLDEKATVLISQGMAMEGNTQKNCFYTPNKTTFTPKEFWAEKSLEDYYDAIRRSDIGNSPMYYVVLHTWIKAFGISDFSIRFLSVLWSVATILLLYIFVSEHFKNKILALICAFLMAIEPFFIAISQQARNYSMSFFLTLLATHIFLKIIKNEEANKVNNKLYIIYGLLSAVCLLSHFLTATVFMAHGLYVLLFVRKLRPWLILPMALSIGALVFGYWVTYGGGNYTFHTLNYQAKLYYKEAHSIPNTHAGYIDPATPKNVLKKASPIFTDLFFFTNGILVVMAGKRNLLIALFIMIASIVSLKRYRDTQKIQWAGILVGLNLVGLFFYTTNKWHYLIFINTGLLLYLLVEYWRSVTLNAEKKQLWFLLILAFLPTLFLVLMTFKNGHTFGLTQRYSGFSFPYSIILVSLALSSAPMMKIKPLNYIIWAIFAIQVLLVGQTVKTVLNDQSLKYNYRDKARSENPYPIIAKQLITLYQTGDTISYPSFVEIEYQADEYTSSIKKSFLDAQYVNIYLPKNAEYIQTVNAKEKNRIILKKKDGRQIEVFDFKNRTFRY